MDAVLINLKNCYGISEFNHELEFKDSYANLIYASNGVMKTSFAKTFSRISSGKEPEEKLFNLKSEYEIKIDGADIKPEQIFVVHPFDPNFESKNISTLLINTEKKTQYDSSYKEILDAKQKIVTKLNKLSRIKKEDIESQMSNDLGTSNLFESIKCLQRIELRFDELKEIKYTEIFDEKVIALVTSDEFKVVISDYTERYNDLIESSSIYSRGKFNPGNAEAVSKILKKERFFEANHKLLLNGFNEPLSQSDEFDLSLKQARDEVFNDDNLKAIHSKILGGVASIKTFHSILEEFPCVSALLADIDKLKLYIWLAYYASCQVEFDALVSLYEIKKDELALIESEAKLEETLWHEAKETFKDRFHVPFDIDVENHTNAILGTTAPNIVL